MPGYLRTMMKRFKQLMQARVRLFYIQIQKMNNPENKYQNATVVLNRVREVIDKNKASDLFHKAFLRPQEILLKTWITQNDKTKTSDSLPYGLKQVIKKDISFNKYVAQDFKPFEELTPDQRNIQYVRENNYDNLISLLKPRGEDSRIQICICICMYSEDKTMLRKTLAGVSNNIATFVQNGIPSDDIIVAVVMDGIEKVDPSVVELFGEFEKQSNIYLDDEVEQMDPKEIVKEDFSQVDEEEVININGFLFDEFQLTDRKKRRFAERKKEYMEIKNLSKKIEKHELNSKITFDDLEERLKEFFFLKAKEYYKREFAQQDFEIDKGGITEEILLREYADNVKKGRPVIYEALSEAKSYCRTYLETREPLALLNSFRIDVTFGSFDKKKTKKDKNYQPLTKEQREANVVKMNLMFITKYKNSGKLSSHNWFFNGLCRQIKTQFSVLLDVGLCPEKTALFKMYNHMKNDAKCGGVCGYMNLRIEMLDENDEQYLKEIDWLSRFFMHFVDIQRAQQVGYHFAHLIDKPFEALFKFIHVLPGAFSAYKMKALQPSEQQDSELMRQYFKSLEESTSRQLVKTTFTAGRAFFKVLLPDFLYNKCFKPKRISITDQNGVKRQVKQLTEEQLLYNSNVYLAEDRTLCMGIHQNGFQLHYLPDSHAWVDPIKHLHGLLGQRKRWINGSFFAFESVKEVLNEQSRGDCCLKLQIFYLNLMNMLAFVSPALFLFTVHIAMFAFRDWFFGYVLNNLTSTQFRTTEFYNSFVFVMDFIYIMLMFGLVFKSMHFTHRQERFIPFVYGMSTVMGMFAIAVFIVLIVDMVIGIIDSIKCFGLTDQTKCQITFLAQNPTLRTLFFKSLPGGVMTFIIYKWLVVGVVALYVIPILIYAIFYCKGQFLGDVLFGTISFIYYTPTYLNILNTFALCRIDDISWGTKGLDAEDDRNKDLKDSWKSIKILNVAKFLFWNIIVGAAMLIVSSPINLYGSISTEEYSQLMVDSYVRKFFMTFFLMAVIGFALFLKIILGAMYSIGYRCSSNTSEKKILKGNGKVIKQENSKANMFFIDIKKSMDEELREYIHGVVNNVKQKKFTKGIEVKNLNSLILANKKLTDDATRRKQKEKWNKLVESQSKIDKKGNKSVKEPIKKIQEPVMINLNQAQRQSLPLQPQPRSQPQSQPNISPLPQPISQNQLQPQQPRRTSDSRARSTDRRQQSMNASSANTLKIDNSFQQDTTTQPLNTKPKTMFGLF